MDHPEITRAIDQLAAAIEQLIPEYLANPADRAIADGNLALCVVDDAGHIYGRLYGADRVKQRSSANVAWRKVMQVWLTGVATGRYEEHVYAHRLNWWEYGIPLPELIGWEGGQPAQLADGTRLALAFSGLRGEQDCEIVRRAAAQVPGLSLAVAGPTLRPV